jgi:hypothetical protein
MSAWSIGADRVRAQKLSGKDAAIEMLGRVARWIPGDILVLFAGAINWVSAEPAHPSVRLLVVFLVATPVVVVLGAFAKQDVVGFDFVKAALATLAFAIWSLSIPRSGWQEWRVVSENPGWVTTVSALGGLMFGLLASGIERKYGSGEYEQN